MNNNNGQLTGAAAEMHEEERKDAQARTTAYGHRRKDEIGTVEDLKLWRKRKREMDRRREECYE